MWVCDPNPCLGLRGQGPSILVPTASPSLGRPVRVLGWHRAVGPEGRWHSTCISHRPVACQRGDAGGPCAGAARCSHAAGSARLGSTAELTSVVWQEEPPRGVPARPLSHSTCPPGLGVFVSPEQGEGKGRQDTLWPPALAR